MAEIKDDLSALRIEREPLDAGGRRWMRWLLLVLLMAAAGGGVWYWLNRERPIEVEVAAVTARAAGTQASVLNASGYVTAAVCAPSRASLLTGRYAQRYGFDSLTHDRYPRNRLERFLVEHLLASHGWQPAPGPAAVPPGEDGAREGVPPSELLLSELLKKHALAVEAPA